MDFLLMLGTIIPKEKLVQQLKDAIEKYETDDSEENFTGICCVASLLLVKHQTKGDIKEASKLDKEMNEMDKAKSFMPGHN